MLRCRSGEGVERRLTTYDLRPMIYDFRVSRSGEGRNRKSREKISLPRRRACYREKLMPDVPVGPISRALVRRYGRGS